MVKRKAGRGFGVRLITLALCSLTLIPLKAQAEENGQAGYTVVQTAVESVPVQEADGTADAWEYPASGQSAPEQDAPEQSADGLFAQKLLSPETEAALAWLSPEELVMYEQMKELFLLQQSQTEQTRQQMLAVEAWLQAADMQAQSAGNAQMPGAQAQGVSAPVSAPDPASVQLLAQLGQAYDSQKAQLALMQEQLELVLESARVRAEEADRVYGPEIIFVGDSRTVQMRDAVGANPYVWICKSSEGCQWFAAQAVPQIDAAVGYGTKILLNLGVNDVHNVNRYAQLVNQKAKEWTAQGATVYYASVNPVENGQYITTKMVSSFNDKLRQKLDPEIIWIDSCSWLQNTGYTLTDGLHFSSKTSRNLYQYYLSVLGESE